MRQFMIGLILVCAIQTSVLSQTNTKPFLGRWDFNVPTPTGTGGNWLGVSDKGGALDVWFQPTGGHVHQVKNYKVDGSHLTLSLEEASATRPAMSWTLEPSGDRLVGVQKQGEKSTPLNGVRAPELKRSAPKAWSQPQSLFDGKDLQGWQPIGNVKENHWTVTDGFLVNQAHGANLRTDRTFNDFKVHFEVNCPDHANSGFYLRGRYEVQLESEPLTKNPPERRIGSIYGRIAAKGDLPRPAGQWETFDITLVGRTVTVVRNGVTVIDGREIEGITGGALDANEGEPGPFYIQGDHTGGLKFRNITVSVPKT
jgi:hypothetical protein